RDLRRMIATHEFREDLYYRLAGTTLELPALKDRADKGDLIRTLLQEECGDEEPVDISANAYERMVRYDWPGNIRQLRNVLRTAAALCDDRVIRLSNLPQEIIDQDQRPAATTADGAPAARIESPAVALQNVERAALVRALEQYDWNVSHAARELRMSRSTLYRKFRKHAISPPVRG
ncbi:MAG: helix-turn-helix domain-containing protein, partial [Rhodanobacteraceae bacterium]